MVPDDVKHTAPHLVITTLWKVGPDIPDMHEELES